MSDISRTTFDPRKHYRAVVMQQGRVQVDADWNEQRAIDEHLATTEATDVIGRCGVPRASDGFKVGVGANGTDLSLSPGRIYVDGLLCELEDGTTYTTQPDLPEPEFTVPADATASPPESPPGGGRRLRLEDGTYVVFLDVWQRELTALDDARIREVALGGPDTAARRKLVWQLKLFRVATEGLGPVSCETVFEDFARQTAPSSGTLNAQTITPTADQGPCSLPPSAGYRRVENQLYRVQVHKGGPREQATYKWSRDNASVETAIERIDGARVTVSDLGKDDVLGFAAPQWVEVVDDVSELNGAPRALAQIDAVTKATREIVLKTPLPGLGTSRRKLRRWDQGGATATADGIAMTTGWVDLEDGVQVQFAPGTYRAGDYWLIAARTATGDVEWPPFQRPNQHPIPQPPFGIAHHFCRLALLTAAGGTLTVLDCRKTFPPLTELPAVSAPAPTEDPGVHVTGIELMSNGGELVNDTRIAVSEFLPGLRIVCDRPIDPATVIGRPTCIITLELPFTFNSADRQLWGDAVIGFQPIILAAEPTVLENVIAIRLLEQCATWLQGRLFQAMKELRRGDTVLCRMTVKGNFIWDAQDPERFLDGEALGVRTGGSQEPTRLRLPSGNGRRGGDFEMWFHLVAASALHVVSVNFLRVVPGTPAETPSSAGVITFPRSAAPVRFRVNEGVNVVEIRFNRPVSPRGFGPNGTPQGVVLLREGTPLAGDLKVGGTVARLTLRDPVRIQQPGPYRLLVFGEPTPVPVTAEDDGSPLDGDFSGQPGGTLTLLFDVTP